MSQQYRYPSSAAVTVAAVGSNGAAIPTSSILIGAENPSHNLMQLQVDASGNLKVTSSLLPSSLGQKTMANSLSVAIASDQSAVPISAASLPLPTGAATQATLSTLNSKSPGSDVTAAYDYREFTYVGVTNDISTIVYKTGGSGGTTVATQTFGYDGSNRLQSITTT